jgi:hypothetical protein
VIDCILFTVLRPAQEFFTHMETSITIAGEGLQNLRRPQTNAKIGSSAMEEKAFSVDLSPPPISISGKIIYPKSKFSMSRSALGKRNKPQSKLVHVSISGNGSICDKICVQVNGTIRSKNRAYTDLWLYQR